MPDQFEQPPADAIAREHHVRVPVVVTERAVAGAMLATLRERAPDPDVFDEHPPIFFRATASNNLRDSHYTRMQQSSLKNYARDASAGVPFLDSHQHTSMRDILGRTVGGTYHAAKGDEPQRVMVDFYVQPSLAPAMKEFADRARAGLATDVSIGFYDDRTLCSVCGKEMFQWFRSADDAAPCFHIPGIPYPDPSNKKKTVTPEGLVEDAHLSELSTVYKGSTPGASIVGYKARQLAEHGLLLPETRGLIEARYNLRLPETARRWTGIAPTPQEDDAMPDKDETQTRTFDQAALDAAIASARNATTADYKTRVIGALADAGVTVEENGDIFAHIRGLGADVKRLTPLADDGSTYRKDLIDAAVIEGVRAFGNDFAEEAERAELGSLNLDGIKRRSAMYKSVADGTFKPGQQAAAVPEPVADDAPLQPLTNRRRRAGAYRA